MDGSSLKIVKRISDPVHGTIDLTQIEVEVIDTRVFQRLRNIKHLGLAHLVFPAADFSRFAHSLGVCHVTGKLLSALSNAGAELSVEDHQKYRLAGLLHDIGHYPLSHALERPVIDHLALYALYEPSSDESGSEPEQVTGITTLDHEAVGKIILEEDDELQEVLATKNLNPTEIADIFTRTQDQVLETSTGGLDPLVNLVSSDLDADRIDFLLRTATSTGLPYGSVDLDYILSQILLDASGRVCLHERALRTVDHLLLARFFDSQQVAFHKTVAVLEELAKDIVGQLLSNSHLEINELWIRDQIRSGEWHNIDDAWLMRKIRDAEEIFKEDAESTLGIKIRALLDRKPPKLVASEERFRDLNKSEADRDFERVVREYKTVADQVADECGLSRDLFYRWSRRAFRLSKVGSSIPADDLDQEDKEQEEKWAQSVRILPRGQAIGSSRAIMRMEGSLMSILSNYALDSVRLYFLEPPDQAGIIEDVRIKLRERLV